MAVRNFQTGKQAGIDLVGLKDLQKQLGAIMTAAAGEEAAKVAASAGVKVLEEVGSRAEAVNVPHQVLKDLFLFTRQAGTEKGSVTALVGLRKRGRNVLSLGYVTWFASRQVGRFKKTSRTKSKAKSLTMTGTKIGENLGTMWELGTTKMKPRPWFRPAIMAVRAAVVQTMADGYNAILAKHAR